MENTDFVSENGEVEIFEDLNEIANFIGRPPEIVKTGPPENVVRPIPVKNRVGKRRKRKAVRSDKELESQLKECDDILKKGTKEIFKSLDKIVAVQEHFIETAKKLKKLPFNGYICPVHRTPEGRFCNDIYQTQTCVLRPKNPKVICPIHKTLEGGFCDDIVETETCVLRLAAGTE